MISIRASSLDEFAACQRRFAAKWLIAAEHDWAKDLNRTRPSIGAIVGTASHTGVAYLLNELKRTGSHGGALRVRHAKQAAAEEMHKEPPGPITTDDTTKTLAHGLVATHKIIDAYHHDVRHEHEPVIVERGLKLETMAANTNYQLTGTMDSYLMDGTLEDLKTGVRRPKPFAQIGAYSLLLKANENEVSGSKIRYAKRVGYNRQQPSIEAINMDITACERHALNIADQAADGLARMLESGDPSHFIANPDMLCSEKYCPAWKSGFCVYGTMC